MIDDVSRSADPKQSYGKVRERHLFDVSPHGQSILMTKCVAEQILGKMFEIISINLEIYSLDVKVIMKAELNELKHFRNVLFKGSNERQLIELRECRTLMMKFSIIGKTMTSNGETVLWKCFVVLCGHVENNPIVNELEYGLGFHCSRERTQQTTDKHDFESGDLRMTTTIDGKLNKPVVKLDWHPCSMKVFFGRKTWPAMLTPVTSRQRMSIGNMLSK